MSHVGSLEGSVIESRSMPNCLPKPVPYALSKRIFDLVAAILFLALLTPFFIVIGLLVKLTSKGPILYIGERIGHCGKPIKFIKFRTMVADADAKLKDLHAMNEKDGPIFKMRNDPRITPLGRFLRKFSLDELPQLWSVLKGDMSIVGPRPPLPREVELYDERAMQRLSVLPGITCYWQIMGRSNLSFEEWLELDLKYIQDMNFWLDLQIVLKTPLAVLKGQGAY